ncbi:hypothetical protein ALC62_15184 [Cyphomyrmex costatus]|uniref:Transposable element P transposase-like RNase H C-terminal domain-containing protein n=1 Tax=Cyphomyrmex costatus TaxID=456900 RepID=A0A151I7X5_9HYME|nr:hypothetical protein ALC62_15184 [Cyphomyrmex costatus]
MPLAHHESTSTDIDMALAQDKSTTTDINMALAQDESTTQTTNINMASELQEEGQLILQGQIDVFIKQQPEQHELTLQKPDLEDITRKNLLTPRARKLYEKTVQLKKEKRYLQRRINKNLSDIFKITKQYKKNKKGRTDNTAPVRLQILNMIIRNHDVAPQVFQKNTFLVGKQEIIPFYDYVHLQKGIRNNLLTKDLLVTTNVKKDSEQFVSWDDIITVYEMDKYSFLRQRQMPKLNDKHIYPNMIPKMEGLTSIITDTSNHIQFWTNACNKLLSICTPTLIISIIVHRHRLHQHYATIRYEKSNFKELYAISHKDSAGSFVEKKTHQAIRRNSPKCLVNWIWTIQNAKYLWYVLQKHGFSSFNLKHINQDIIENAFSKIRDFGHRNNNPSPLQFSAFKTLVTTNLTSNHYISSNCEESKEGKSLSLLRICHASNITESKTKQNSNTEYVECTEAAIPDAITKNMFVDAQTIITMIEKEKCIMDCEECLQIIKHNFILELVQHALDMAELQFPQFCHEIQVMEKLKNVLNETFSKFMIHCSIVRNIIIDITAKQFILQWCKFINQVLTGKVEVEDDANFMYVAAKRMYCKKKKQIRLFFLRVGLYWP